MGRTMGMRDCMVVGIDIVTDEPPGIYAENISALVLSGQLKVCRGHWCHRQTKAGPLSCHIRCIRWLMLNF
jgi:hypothetical protein